MSELDSPLIENVLKLFKIVKFFGFNTFTVENGRAVTKPRDLYLFFQGFSIGFTLIVIAIKYKSALGTSNSIIADYGNFIAYIASLAIALISMVVSFVNRKRVWKIVKMMSEVDTKLKKIGFSAEYERIAIKMRAGMITMSFMTFPLSISIYFIEKSFLKALLYWYSGIYFILSVGSVIGLMNGTFIRLESITTLCKSLLHRQRELKTSGSNDEEITDIELISGGSEIYGDIMEIYGIVNICNGVQAMLGVGLVYFYSIFTSFMVYRDLRDDGRLNNITIASIMYASYLHIFTTILIFVCSFVEKEPQKASKILKAILQRSKNKTEVAMLISFSSLIRRRPPKFSCALFDFDWSLVYSILASASTNFVILMQFDLASRSEATGPLN